MSDLDDIRMFHAVVETEGFRAAGRKIGVSGSAVSQAVRRLEERVGIVLLQRSTRGVRVTGAGDELYAATRVAFADVDDALASVAASSDRPRGPLRLSVSGCATAVLCTPTLAGFLRQHPEIQLDLHVTGLEPEDIVASGYDAGIRMRDLIAADMITVRASEPQRAVVVGAPDYLERCPPPLVPADLDEHACITWRPDHDGEPLAWEFRSAGQDIALAVDGPVVTTDLSLTLRLTLEGVGLSMQPEHAVREHLATGELVPVLEEYSKPLGDFFLYFPSKQAPPALRALVDYLKEGRRQRRSA